MPKELSYSISMIYSQNTRTISSFRTIELSDDRFEWDGLRFMTIKTPNLKGRGDLSLYVPKDAAGENLPIYILLHGVYGSAWAWPMKGGAHRTAQRLMVQGEIKPCIVAFPSDGLWGDGSAYFPHHEKNFEQWIVSDVPTAIRENIPGAGENSPLCIGGLSMGGYGALLLGGRHPEKFSAISAHSSITALKYMEEFVEEPMSAYHQSFEGEDVLETFLRHKDHLPALRFDCGIADSLLEANRDLNSGLTAAGIEHIYEEFAGGHEWSYWEEHVEQTFRFFNQSVFT